MRPGLDRPPASTMRAKVAPESPCFASCPMAASMICVRRSRATEFVCMNKTLVQLNKSSQPPTIPRPAGAEVGAQPGEQLVRHLGRGCCRLGPSRRQSMNWANRDWPPTGSCPRSPPATRAAWRRSCWLPARWSACSGSPRPWRGTWLSASPRSGSGQRCQPAWARASNRSRCGHRLGRRGRHRRSPHARALIAGHQLFTAALAAGAAARLLAMLGYPGALWFAGDSYVYLGAALRLRPDLSKTTGYSLFLRALEPLHSLTLVAGLQHLMGLGIAVMIYLLLRRAGVPPRWATAATLPVLLDGFEIEDEHMVMAEALFTFLVMAALLLMLWRRQVSWPVALLAGLLAGYAVDVRSEGLPVLVLFPVALLLRQDGAWRWRNGPGWLAAIAM